MGKSFVLTALFSVAYLFLTLACLIDWRAPAPWSRISLFAWGYLALRFLGTVHSLYSSRAAFRSQPLRREWWALTSAEGKPRWVVLLMLLDLSVFLDYGHWHLLPALERPALEALGLGLYFGVAVWQVWTDEFLAKHFSQRQPKLSPIENGPYRYIRHPRYAAAITGKIAAGLVFASVLAWPLALAWAFMLIRKVGVEEVRLRTLFGAEYEAYAHRTAKLLPGVW
jgi:protein-S-isoprenylcysteine O-methyltransferase Ste14